MRLFLLFICLSSVHGKVFQVPLDYKDCSLVRCKIVTYFVDFVNGSLQFSDCGNDCEIQNFIDNEAVSSFYYFEFHHPKVIVPRNPKLNREFYMFMPFRWEIWIVIVFSILYFTIIIRIINLIEWKQSDWSMNLVKTIQTLFSPGSTFGTSSNAATFIYFLIIGYGFIISISYSTFLGSFFVKDLQNLKIVCPKMYLEDGKKLQYLYVSRAEFLEAMATLNTSFAYCVTIPFEQYFRRDFRNAMFKLAQHSGIPTHKPLYYFSEKCISEFAGSYHKYLMYLYSSGLIDIWGAEVARNNIPKSLRKLSQTINKFEELVLDLNEFKIPLICLGVGLAFAFSAFCIEFLTVKFSK